MKQLYLDIITHLGLKMPEIKHFSVFNNQFEQLKDGTVDTITFPCVFVEFTTDNISQLGNGVQAFDPLVVKLHIGDNYFTGENGLDVNLNILDLRSRVTKYMHGQYFNGCSGLIRYSEEQDNEHTNVYHFIQYYKTEFIDTEFDKPVDRVELKVDNLTVAIE